MHGAGLLIGNMADGATVDISWVETVNYQTRNDGAYAASALIGQVGTMNAENLILDFTNIQN